MCSCQTHASKTFSKTLCNQSSAICPTRSPTVGSLSTNLRTHEKLVWMFRIHDVHHSSIYHRMFLHFTRLGRLALHTCLQASSLDRCFNQGISAHHSLASLQFLGPTILSTKNHLAKQSVPWKSIPGLCLVLSWSLYVSNALCTSSWPWCLWQTLEVS